MIKACKSFISNRKRLFDTIIISLVGALFINIASFIRDNIPYTFFEDLDAVNYLRLFYSGGCSDLKEGEIDDAIFVDVSKYVELASESSALAPNGKVSVINRDTILHFLQKVESINFSYLFLDIYFEDGLNDVNNEELFKKIREINQERERIVVCRNIEVKEDSLFRDYSAPNLYYEPKFSRMFTRGVYINNGFGSSPLKQASVPVKIYNATHSDTIPVPQEWWGMEIGKYKLFIPHSLSFRNSPLTYIPIDEKLYHNIPTERNDSNTWGFYDISKDIETILTKASERIIFVGDMRDTDMHATYARTICGPYLTYLQYKYLERIMNGLSWYLGWVTFFIYFIIFMIRINWNTIKVRTKEAIYSCCVKIKKRSAIFATIFGYLMVIKPKSNANVDIIIMFKSLFVTILSTFLGYTFLFGLISLFMLVFFEIAYSTFIPSIVFSILEIGIRSLSKYKVYKNKRDLV